MLDAFDSKDCPEIATVSIAPLANGRSPVLETPVVMLAGTPGIIGMLTVAPVVVVAAVVVVAVVVVIGVIADGGAEKMVIVVPVLLLPLSVPGGGPPAWLGNCQTANINGLRPRAKMRFLIFNMMIL
jgi:hypothetical protein